MNVNGQEMLSIRIVFAEGGDYATAVNRMGRAVSHVEVDGLRYERPSASAVEEERIAQLESRNRALVEFDVNVRQREIEKLKDERLALRKQLDMERDARVRKSSRVDEPDAEIAKLSELVPGPCRDVWGDDPFANFKCSECGGELAYRDKERVSCCPFCRRKVV